MTLTQPTAGRGALPLALAALLLAAPGVVAHHSLTAIYDGSSRVQLDGVVKAFKLVNPHPWVELEVSDADGRVRTWRLEMDNLWELNAIGVTAETLVPGDRVVVSGSPARDRSPAMYVRQLDRPEDGFRYEQVGMSPRIRAGTRRMK